MIVGTAGHIDHGKSTLVRALTGVDTDRLPEEKKRGISIELGYAFLDVPESGERIGFVDVPGHERLVHTMLAGASGIDFALLLVAADDGVMPQTREHLAVLSLLGKERGAVVLTKADRVDAAQLDAVELEVRQLLQGSTLAQALIVRVSAQTGQGVDALRELLWQEARFRAADQVPVQPALAFRLAIDRSFTLGGTGTVVTGTIHHGSVRVGDTLSLVPSMKQVRVRSLHAQNQPVQQAQAGQRCAVALAGIDKDAVHRGDWLVDSAVALATDRFDVTLTLWKDEEKPLRSGARVQVHLGAASVPGTVALLDAEQLPPGGAAKAQIITRTPLGAWHGDRVVLRDASATRTMAGGQVLDPRAPVRYRRTPQRLALLAALQQPSVTARLSEYSEINPNGMDLRNFSRSQGILQAPTRPEDALERRDGDAHWILAATPLKAVLAHLATVLASYHEQHPDELGPVNSRLRRLAQPRMPEALWQAVLEHAEQQGILQLKGPFVHLPEHGVRLSATEERVAQKALPHLLQSGAEGAWARDLAKLTAEPEPLLRATLARLACRGELHQVVKDLYYAGEIMRDLAHTVRRLAEAQDGQLQAADFRDATGLGRKRAIQILEYFDRIGLLRRVGDVHKLRTDCSLFQESA
ncbi:selenocysteine-specific translation elongation factor [Brachymonas denitrificans]|uniref:Selenocysteine-specific elongation factor n=1 Tax=Brachymonas denitrificans DSM 15123 TaxID=1121117 RepID=A0A1H8IYM7_9BURK|nr:selenocysteine-specific translation elongation factor [Brachymonas denitrificans]SEN73694.1 selenocysteine-specific elongation factor [Brachymonas denitrificans DSM 15123]